MTNLPISGTFQVTATYGQKGKYWANGHQGIDFVCSNKSIYATCDGTVRVVAYDASGWGQYVSIGDAEGRRHIFCHLVQGSVKVKVGQKVNRNTLIGTMGTSGNSSGVHLHYQINNANGVSINPCPYLGIPNAKGTYQSIDYQIEKTVVFKDATQIASWAKAYVDKIAKAGVMSGDADGNFRPTAALTRAEVASIIYRGWKDHAIFKQTAANISKPFKDVPSTAWYYKAVEACRKAGILYGDTHGNCNPTSPIKRQDVIVMIMRIRYTPAQLAAVNVNTLVAKSGVKPIDFNKVSDYAKPAMALALGDLINGDSAGAIHPTATITRQEAAGVFVKALKL